jgi:transcriptional regulator of NAD metabolism
MKNGSNKKEKRKKEKKKIHYFIYTVSRKKVTHPVVKLALPSLRK